jgi:hypothetical protein
MKDTRFCTFHNPIPAEKPFTIIPLHMDRLGRGKRDPLKVCGGPGYFHPSVEARTRELCDCLGVESGSQDMTCDARRMLGESTLRNQRWPSQPDERRKTQEY